MTKNKTTEIGRRIRSVRESKKLSRHQVCQRAKLAEGSLYALETTSRQPELDTLRRLADALGVGIDKLLGC